MFGLEHLSKSIEEKNEEIVDLLKEILKELQATRKAIQVLASLTKK